MFVNTERVEGKGSKELIELLEYDPALQDHSKRSPKGTLDTYYYGICLE